MGDQQYTSFENISMSTILAKIKKKLTFPIVQIIKVSNSFLYTTKLVHYIGYRTNDDNSSESHLSQVIKILHPKRSSLDKQGFCYGYKIIIFELTYTKVENCVCCWYVRKFVSDWVYACHFIQIERSICGIEMINKIKIFIILVLTFFINIIKVMDVMTKNIAYHFFDYFIK